MKKILATGGMLAYMLYFNSTGALAATMPEIVSNELKGPAYHQHVRGEKNKEEKSVRLATKIGVDMTKLKADITADMSIKHILKKHHITKNQFRELTKK